MDDVDITLERTENEMAALIAAARAKVVAGPKSVDGK